MTTTDREWLLALLKQTAEIAGDSSRQWKAASAVEQAAYRAGIVYCCLEIIDAVERRITP